MIDYELYRIFKIVAEEKNITKASKKLSISQPAVTKRIKNLEYLLNVKLFDRSQTGMELTKNGEKLYLLVNEPINDLEKVEEAFKTRSVIRVGTRRFIFSSLFSNVVNIIYKKFNYNLEMNIEFLLSDELFDNLLKEKIDIVIYVNRGFEKRNEKIKFIPLGKINDVFVVNKDYFEKMNRTFSKSDIKKELIFTAHNTSLTAIKLQNELNYSEKEKENIKYVRNSILLEMVKNEDCIGMIPKEYIQKEIDEGIFKVLKTDFSISKTEFGVYYNKNNRFKELDEIIKIIKENFKI